MNYQKQKKKRNVMENKSEYFIIEEKSSFSKTLAEKCLQMIYNVSNLFIDNIHFKLQNILSHNDQDMGFIFLDENMTIWIVFKTMINVEDLFVNTKWTQTKFHNVMIYTEFLNIYLQLQEQILSSLSNLKPNHEIVITGYSLGGAFAIISTYDLLQQNYDTITYTFGSPRVGNPDFCNEIRNQRHVFCIENDCDIIPCLPPSIIAKPTKPIFFEKCGTILSFSDNAYNYNKNHSLEIYLDNIHYINI
jgi:hypothetical protein